MTRTWGKCAVFLAASLGGTGCSQGSSQTATNDGGDQASDGGDGSPDATQNDSAGADAGATSNDGGGAGDAPQGDGAPADGRAADGGAGDGGAAMEHGGFCTGHWCWSNPLPQGNPIDSFWVSPSGRIWAGSAAGLVMTYDGTAWSAQDVGDQEDIYSLWGTSDTDVWAAPGGHLWHFDGTSWTRDGSTLLTNVTVWGISGTSATDVWVATNAYATSQSPALHYDGTSWKQVTGAPITDFDGVRAESATSIWFTSTDTNTDAGVYRWDGTAWHTMWTQGAASSLWISGPQDVWFNGADSLMRSTGATFNPIFQNLNMYGTSNYQIFGSGPSDVWAVDSSGDPRHMAPDGGFTFTSLSDGLSLVSAGIGASTGVDKAVLAGAAGRIWLANGATGALTVPPLTEAASSGVSYSAVWSDGAGTVLAGGGRVARLSQGDGGADVWTFVPSVQDSGTLQEVGGIWGSSGTDAWAVGTYGQIFHYDGSILTEVGAGLPSGNPSHIGWLAVAGSSAQDVWAVGTNGQTTHYDGTKWTLSGGTGVADLTGVWIDPQTHDPWACGKGGKLMHHTAASGWQSIASTPAIDYTAITGTSTTAIYITGMGSVLRYDGTTFTDVSPPTTDPLFSNHWYLYAMTADGLGGVVAVGEGGAAMHFDGSSTWTWEDTRFNEQLSGIWLQNGSGWAVGQFGAILRRRP